MAEAAVENAIDLTKYTEQLHEALAQHTPCVVATADAKGNVDIGLKGSVMVWDRDHLAYLERTHGVHLQHLQENKHIAIQYYNRQNTPAMIRFFGEAELLESGPLRDEIRSKTIAPELAKDPDNRGIIVLIRIDKVIEPGGKTFLRS